MATLDDAELESILAIGLLRRGTGEVPELAGTGFVVDAHRHLIISCCHVYCEMEKAYSRNSTVYLDPSVHGVAVGTARLGQPIRWYGKAMLQARKYPPRDRDHPQYPVDGLDLAILKLTHLDGSPVPPEHKLLALKLGDSEKLKDGELLKLYGFGKPVGGSMETMRPAASTFNVITPKGAQNPSGPWIEATLGDQPGHSGAPVLNQRKEVVGWVVRAQTYKESVRISEARPVNELEELLATVVGEPELRGAALRRALKNSQPDAELEEKLNLLADSSGRGAEWLKQMLKAMGRTQGNNKTQRITLLREAIVEGELRSIQPVLIGPFTRPATRQLLIHPPHPQVASRA